MAKIGILGAGSWGTALAVAWSRVGVSVLLKPRDPAQAQVMRNTRLNTKYLPGVILPELVDIWTAEQTDEQLASQLRQWDACVIATPAESVVSTLKELAKDGAYPENLPLIIASKGFDPEAGELLPRVIERQFPEWSVLVLSGPSFAIEVGEQLPTALVLAGRSDTQTQTLSALFHQPRLRIYRNRDPIGVAWAGAHKNVLAIAAGIADALKLGANARAALITRGLAEMRRLGVAQGARDETFLGLSGVGDLVLTATDPMSRNFRLGRFLGQGMDVDSALERIGQVVEGRWSAGHVYRFAQEHLLSAPLTEAVFDIIEGRLSPQKALEQLLLRQRAVEFG